MREQDVSVARIAVVAGDGIGTEVTAQARKVIEAVLPGAEFDDYDLGARFYNRTGEVLPQAIDGQVRRHLAQPEQQVRIRFDGGQTAMQLHEYFLRQVLSFVSVAEHAQRQAVYETLVRADQRRKRKSISRTCAEKRVACCPCRASRHSRQSRAR